MFQGQITRSGDFYNVTLPIGEICIRANRVAFECDTLEQAYRQRRATFRFGSADEHIELAQWCQRSGLLTQAAAELAEAMADEPNNPKVAHFKRQLELAMHPQPAATQPHAARPSDSPTLEELDAMMRQMPPGSIEMFTNTIQPLLVNSCTTSGCHGPQKDEGFCLIRTSSGRPPNRRVTQRNLYAALQWIDRKQPENSRLLAEAIHAHGNVEKPIFTDKDALKYRQMVQWVHYVAKAKRAEDSAPKTVNRPDAMETANPLFTSKITGPSPSQPAAASPSPWDLPNNMSDPSGQPARSPAKRGAAVKQFVPADPFDPEIFNRRYHPKTVE